MILKHEMSRVFQGLVLSLRKPVDVCTVLTTLLKYKRDNAFKMHYHSICMHKEEVKV